MIFKNKLIIAVSFIGILAILLGGCNTSGSPANEPIVFSVLYNDIEEYPFDEDWLILEEYKKQKNIILDVRLGDDSTFDNVLAQTLGSKDLPDIILKCWPENIESYAYDGTLLPFSDYEDLMPYFTAYIEEYGLQDELDKLRLENGKYYILPGYQREIQVQQWIYRRDLFEKHGLNAPKTYDELFDSLLFLKKLYPNTAPITASWNGAHLFAMMGAGYRTSAGWSGIRYYDHEKDLWLFSPATKNYKALYGFLNDCFEAEILDPEIFTQSNTEFINKIEDGRALVTVTWITSGFSHWNEKLKENGISEGKWASLIVPESTIGIRALPPVNRFRKGLVVPASVTSKSYLEDLLMFLDWAVYSDEGMTLSIWGVEGVTFENTSDGKVFLPHIKTPKNPDGTDDIRENGLNLLFNLNENIEYEDYKKPIEIVEFLEVSQKAGDAAKISPRLKLDEDENKIIDNINEIIIPYMEESTYKFITGELDIDEDWEEYLLELESMGYKTIEDVWNAAWKKQNN